MFYYCIFYFLFISFASNVAYEFANIHRYELVTVNVLSKLMVFHHFLFILVNVNEFLDVLEQKLAK